MWTQLPSAPPSFPPSQPPAHCLAQGPGSTPGGPQRPPRQPEQRVDPPSQWSPWLPALPSALCPLGTPRQSRRVGGFQQVPRGGQEAGFTRSRLQEAPQGGWPQCLAGWLGHPGRVGAPPYLCAPPPPPSVSEALGHLLRPCRPHASAPGFHMAAWGCRVFSAALGLSLCCDLGSSLGSSLLLTPQPNSKSWALRTGRGDTLSWQLWPFHQGPETWSLRQWPCCRLRPAWGSQP